MARILVTGAAGFIGSHLVEALLDRGDEVVAVDSLNDYYDPAIKRGNMAGALKHPAFTFHEIDICDKGDVERVFAETKADVVVHLAARAGVRPSLEDPNLYHQTNVVGSQHVLDACRDHGASHLVFASSSSVYGGIAEVPFREDMNIACPISPYAATKRMNELMAHVYHHVYGVQVTMLRFFTVYGPRQRPDMAISKFVRLIDEGKAIPMFGDGSTERDYTYVEDIIDGVVKAIDTPLGYEIINLGESETTTLRDLIALVGKHMGVAPVVDVQPLQPGDVTVTYASVDKARRLLGYAPRFTMDEGIGRYVAWYKGSNG
jgi:UDP-glucuronate 4-epimerase